MQYSWFSFKRTTDKNGKSTFKQTFILSPYLLFIDDFDSQTMYQNGIPDNKNLSKFLAATLNIY